MEKKPVISARETYILDEEDLKELDETSLTGVIRDLSSTMEQALPQDIQLEDDDDLDFGILDAES